MTEAKHKHDPFVRMAKRDGIPFWKAWLFRLAAVLLALLTCGLLIFALTGLNPLQVYSAMAKGAFGTVRKSWKTLQDLAMLLCVAIGLAPAFKMRYWNIGGEGQVLMGALMTAICMMYFDFGLFAGASWVAYILIAIVSCLSGALWAIIPAIFKVKWNTNETLFTLMMNYVAMHIIGVFVTWYDKTGHNVIGIINQSTRNGWLPSVFNQQYFLNVAIVLALTIMLFIYLRISKQGYEITVVGESENTARYAGINVGKTVLRTVAISGAICGLAGYLLVAGADHTVTESTAGGRGFTAIIVAWLAKFNAFAMLAVAALLAFLDTGSTEIVSLYSSRGINDNIANVICGIILFFILGCEFFIQYRLIFRSKKGVQAA